MNSFLVCVELASDSSCSSWATYTLFSVADLMEMAPSCFGAIASAWAFRSVADFMLNRR